MMPLLLLASMSGCTGPDPEPPSSTTPSDGTDVGAPTGSTGTLLPSTGGRHTGASTGTGQTADTATETYPFPHCGPLAASVQLGSTIADLGWDVAGTEDGGAVVSGTFSGTVTFGAGETNETVLTASGGGVYADGFVARYAADGMLQWVRQHLDGSASEARAVAVEPATGRVATAGTYVSDLTLDGGGVQHVLPHVQGSDVYIASYDAAGTLQWAVSITSDEYDRVGDLAFGPAGELYFVGWTEDADLTLTSTQGSVVQLANLGIVGSGESSGFLVRIDPDGSLAWTQTMVGSRTEEAQDVTVLTTGEIAVAGEYSTELVLDPSGPFEQTLIATRGIPIFLARYDAAGDFLDVTESTSDGGSDLGGIAPTPTGTLLTTVFSTNSTWAIGTPEESVVAPMSNSVAHYSPDTTLDLLYPFHEFDPKVGGQVTVRAASARDARWAVAGLHHGLVNYAVGQPNEVTIDAGKNNAWEPFLLTFDDDATLDCFWHLDGNTTFDQAYGVSLDGAGGVWVTGKFHDTLTLDQGRPGAVTLTSLPTGNPDLFLARFLLAPPGADTADTGR